MSSGQLITYSSWHFWNIAADAALQAKIKKADQPKITTADSISAIILSAVSTEAFINELATHLTLLQKLELPDVENWIRVGTQLEDLEVEHQQVTAKYLLASKLLPGESLKKGDRLFQDFDRLINVRNDFAHPKAQQERPKYLEVFENWGWTYNKKTDKSKLNGWMTQLETPEIACWACRSAHKIIWNIIERFGDTDHIVIADLYQGMKFQWGKTLSDKRVN